MGPLVLPSTGLVYLDASSLIYSVERIEPHRTLLEPPPVILVALSV